MADKFVIFGLFVVFVLFAGLFAGAETGMYQLSRLRLRLGIQRKRLSYVLLGGIMEDTRGLLLSMLVGTNLAHYGATSVVTVLLYQRFGGEHTAELAATLITAPILFVFSELVPKNIFYYRADYLMPAVAPLIAAFHKLFRISGIVPLLRRFSSITAAFAGASQPGKGTTDAARHPHIDAIIRHSKEEGILSATQTEIFNRLSAMSNINLRAVMTQMEKVETVEANCDKAGLLAKLEKSRHTRLIVRDGGTGDVAGLVNIYEALYSDDRDWSLEKFTSPVRRLPAETTVTEAMAIMRKQGDEMVLVTRRGQGGKDKPAGIVTMKDLAEELFGELAEW